jgi:hypothetical protein
MINELWSGERYTSEELQARLKFFIGIVLGLTLFGIVFVVLYSLIFVTQPMNGMSPVDNKFFELIIPIATFLTGTLSGIMLAGDDKDLRMKAIEAATKPPPPSAPTPSPIRPPSSPAGSFESSAFGAGAVGAAVMATPFPDATPGMPAMAKPAPSRPPLEENFPPLD